MKAEQIETISDAERFCEGLLNDFEMGLSTKAETMKALLEYTARLNELFHKNVLKNGK